MAWAEAWEIHLNRGLSSRSFIAAWLLAALVFIWPATASAQVYWNVTVTSGAAPGTWDQATTSAWSTSSSGGGTNNWANRVANGGSGTVANFSAGTNATGSYTVTVSGDIGNNNNGYLAGIVIDEGTVTFGGTGTLYLRASGITNNTANLLTLSANASLVSNQTWNTGSNGITQNSTSVISGTGNLIKDGAGTLTLGGTAANTNSGTFTVNNGTVVLNKSASTNATGTGAITIGDSTGLADTAILRIDTNNEQINNASAITINSDGQFNVNGRTETVGSVAGAGNLALGSGALTAGGNNNTTTLDGVISGSGNFTKAGTGTLTLTGDNTFTGVLTLNAGTISAANITNGGIASDIGQGANTADRIVFAGGALQYTGATTTSNRAFTINAGSTGTINVNSGTTLTMAGATGTATTGSLIKLGDGTLILSGTQTYTGTTTIGSATVAGGTLTLASDNNLGTGNGAVTIFSGTLSTLTYDETIGALNLGGGASGTSANVLLGDGSVLTLGGTVTYSATNNPNGATINKSGTTGELALGANRTFNVGNSTAATNDLAISAIISGSGFSLTKTGAGTLSLSGANTYTGATNISTAGGASGGTLALGADNVLPNTTVNVYAGTLSTLTFDNTIGALNLGGGASGTTAAVSLGDGSVLTLGGDVTYNATNNPNGATINKSGTTGELALGANRTFNVGNSTAATNDLAISAIISGSGFSLTKTGAGTLSLSGANTYTGATNISTAGGASGGTLALGADNVLPNTTVNVYAGTLSTLTFDNTIGALNLGGGASGTTAAVSLGDGSVLTLGGDVTYNATNNPNGATINKSGTTGELALGANRTFNVGNSTAATNDLAISAIISGSGFSLTKTGAGTLSLSGANTYTGATNISTAGGASGGTLALGADNVLPNTTVNVYAGTLSTLTFDNTIGALNLGGGASGTTAAVSLGDGSVLTLGGDVTYDAANNPNGATINKSGTTGQLALGASRTFNVGDSSAAATDLSISAIISGSGFGITKTGDGTLAFTGANTYTGATNIGTAGGVSGGTLAYGVNNALSSGAVNVYAGTLAVGTFTDTIGALSLGGGASGTTAAVTIGDGGVLTLGGNLTYDATNNPNGATINKTGTTGQLALGTNRVFTIGDSTAATSDLSISAIISGANFGINKQGAGTLTLSGANTFTGVTTFTGGVLSVATIGNGGAAGNLGQASNAANRLVFAGGTLQYTGATASSNRRFTINNGSTGTIDVNTAGTTLTITGATGTGTTGSLVKTGDGTLILNGAQTNSGGTTIGTLGGPSGGTLTYALDNNLSSGAVTIYGGTLNTLTYDDTIGALTLGGGASGTTAAVNLGDGSVLTLGGDVTFNAANNANGATINKTGTSGQLALGATRIFNVGDSTAAANDLAISAIISGSTFGINKQGAGTLVLSGTNTFTGVTTFTGGTLSVGSIGNGGVAGNLGQATNAANRLVFAGGTLQYTGATGSSNRAFTINNATTGTIDVSSASATLTLAGATGTATTGALTKTGAGTLVLSGAQTNTGTTTVNDGILQINASDRIANSSNLVINSPGTFQFDWGTWTETVGSLSGNGTLSIRGSTFITNTAANTTFSGTITDSYGNFRKAGTGDLTLSGNNTYTGLTYIDGGTLIAASSLALGGSTSGNVIANGATLGLQGNITVTEGSFTLQGTGDGGVGAIYNIADSNTLTAALTFGGVTTIGSASGLLTLTNQLTVNSLLTFSGAGDITASGQITGSSGITKTGTGTLTLSGSTSNSFSTTLNIDQGTVLLAKTASTNAVSGTGINVGDKTDNSDPAGSAVLRLGASDQIANYTGLLTVKNDGLFDLNGYSESINQFAGAGQITTGTGGSLTVGVSSGASTFDGTIAGAGTFIKDGSALVTLQGTAANSQANTSVLNGTLAFNKTAGVDATGSGTLTIGDSSGAASSAILRLDQNNQINDAATVLINSDGQFNVNGKTETVGSIAGTGTIALGTGGALSAGINNSSTTYSGVMSGAGSFTKQGTGTTTLSGNNSYSGDTTVSDGVLVVAHSNALGTSGTSNITVNNGATLSLSGGVNIAKTTGTLSLAGAGETGEIGALVAGGTAGQTSQYTGNITLTADATIGASNNLLIIGDDYDNDGAGPVDKSFDNRITLGSHTLTLNTTSASGVVPSYLDFPSYILDSSNLYISSTITGTGGVTKTGDGTANLIFFPSEAGVTSYTGDTIVTGGKLIIDGADHAGIVSANIIVGNAGSTNDDTVILQMGQLSSASANYVVGDYDNLTNLATSSMTVYEDGLFNMNRANNALVDLTLRGGHVTGWSDGSSYALLTVTGGITTEASTQTSLIDHGELGLSANGFTFTIADGAAAEDLRIDSIIHNGIGFTATDADASLIKTGTGTMVFTAANDYQGVTQVQQGVLVIRNNDALGILSPSVGSTDNGTVVSSGAQLQLKQTTGGADLTIGSETLTLNGTGISDTGALYNVTGDNTYNGFVRLGADSRITAESGTTLTIANTGGTEASIMNGTGAGGQNLAVGGPGDVTIGSAIGGLLNNIAKDGSGTLTLAGNNAYAGATTVATGGAIKVTHNQGLSGTGVTVDSGGALQFAQNALNQDLTAITGPTTGTITISGTGLSNGGAIQNLNGTNTYLAGVTLGANARITADASSSLTINGNITGAGYALDAGGAGDTTFKGIVSGTGTTFTKTDTGTSTLAGTSANTFTGGLYVNAGTLNLNKTAGVNAVGTSNTVIIGDGIGSALTATLALQASNQMPDTTDLTINSDGRLSMGTASDTVSQISGTGQIDLGTAGHLTIGTDDSSSVFDGTFASASTGEFTKAGTGSLTFTQDISYNGTFNLGGGVLVLDDMDLTVTNLNITADSTIDFGATGNSHIFAGTLDFLNTSVKLNIINWTKGIDGFFAQFWPGATYDMLDNLNQVPMAQITFDGWDKSNTGWDSFDNQIYPNVPEPSTYGLMFMGAATALFGYRRWRQSKSKKK